MFVDYYNILEISFPSNPEEIKKSYRILSLKYHPDRNPGVDTSEKMVEINEAYYILKDHIKKQRYDAEYQLYCSSRKNTQQQTNTKYTYTHKSTTSTTNQTQGNSRNYWDYSYSDPKVKQDINDAHNYAKDLVDEFLKHLKQTSKDAAKGAWEEMWPYFVVALILPVIFGLIRSCQ